MESNGLQEIVKSCCIEVSIKKFPNWSFVFIILLLEIILVNQTVKVTFLKSLSIFCHKVKNLKHQVENNVGWFCLLYNILSQFQQ